MILIVISSNSHSNNSNSSNSRTSSNSPTSNLFESKPMELWDVGSSFRQLVRLLSGSILILGFRA